MLTKITPPELEIASESLQGPLQTTLYDLIAAICDCVSPSDNGQMVTTTTSRLLDTYQVTCVGDLKGYRMVGTPLSHNERSYLPV